MKRAFLVFALLALGVSFLFAYATFSADYAVLTYRRTPVVSSSVVAASLPTTVASTTRSIPLPITHIATPDPLKAVYMTGWVAGTPHLRDHILELIDATELNAVVLDVKDDTGRISFLVNDQELLRTGASERRIRDIDGLIRDLHARNIYVIGRIAVFQDRFLPTVRPDLALHAKSTGEVWRDRKGLTWLQPRSLAVWEYTARIAREAYSRGFDEINFDYVRFPTDGSIEDLDFGLTGTTTLHKVAEMGKFFAYLHKEVRQRGIPTSADIFGQITSEKNDMGIGQSLEVAARNFDYVAPMVYPSHYSTGFLGLAKPAEHPYTVVHYALVEGVKKLVAASSTPAQLRPWLQDFDLGVTYTAAMVRDQIRATNDAGLTSWMLWDPSNGYTKEALLSD